MSASVNVCSISTSLASISMLRSLRFEVCSKAIFFRSLSLASISMLRPLRFEVCSKAILFSSLSSTTRSLILSVCVFTSAMMCCSILSISAILSEAVFVNCPRKVLLAAMPCSTIVLTCCIWVSLILSIAALPSCRLTGYA